MVSTLKDIHLKELEENENFFFSDEDSSNDNIEVGKLVINDIDNNL